jgi:phosphodiesterase/alkaline phosphatase D-like protein
MRRQTRTPSKRTRRLPPVLAGVLLGVLTFGAPLSFATEAPPSPPTVGTGQPQDPGRTTVSVSGTVDPNGATTTYQFQYTTQGAYETALKEAAPDPYADGQETLSIDIGEDQETHSIADTILEDLAPGTTYHYALVATNPYGTTVGPDRTFTTSPAMPPIVETGGASNITQNTATLTGTIEPQGSPAVYGFEIETIPGGYEPAAGLGSLGTGATSTTVTYNATGLQPNTTYHYRITVTTTEGTTQGQENTFTTGALPNQPTALPFLAIPAIGFPAQTTSTTGKATPKTLTRAQKLAKALKACKHKTKNKRAACEKQARKKYGSAKAKK